MTPLCYNGVMPYGPFQKIWSEGLWIFQVGFCSRRRIIKIAEKEGVFIRKVHLKQKRVKKGHLDLNRNDVKKKVRDRNMDATLFLKVESGSVFFHQSALIWKKTGEKVFNWSEVHFFASTSYEIHALDDILFIIWDHNIYKRPILFNESIFQ